jgi:hypothetical protein
MVFSSAVAAAMPAASVGMPATKTTAVELGNVAASAVGSSAMKSSRAKAGAAAEAFLRMSTAKKV